MNIAEAKKQLNGLISNQKKNIADLEVKRQDSQYQVDVDELENMKKAVERLTVLVEDLSEDFGGNDDVNDYVAKLINNAQSALTNYVTYQWVLDLNKAFAYMARMKKAEQVVNSKKRIDGETAQWVTTISQGVLFVFTIVFTFLFAFGIIPKDAFGALGEDGDAFYYIVGALPQAFALVVAMIIGIINNAVRKNKYAASEFTYDELMGVKYKNNKAKLVAVAPSALSVANDNGYKDVAKELSAILSNNLIENMVVHIKIDNLAKQDGHHNNQYNQFS